MNSLLAPESSVQRIVFLALFSTRHPGEILVTQRGEYYGLPVCLIATEQPTEQDIRAATREIGHVAIGHIRPQVVSEFDGSWDNNPAHFVVFHVVGADVLSRLGLGKIIRPGFEPSMIGRPDVSILRFREARSGSASAPVAA